MNKTDKNKIGTLKFALKHSSTERNWWLFASFAIVFSIVANFLMPQIIRFAVDGVIGDEKIALPNFLQNLVANKSISNKLILCAVAMVVLALISGVFNFLSRMAVATGTEKFCENLRNKLYNHIQHLPFKWQVENQTGEIIQRCTSDLDVVRNFLANQILEVVRTFILVVTAMVLMFSMNVTLSVIALCFVPIIIAYSVFFFILVGKRFLAADEAEGKLTINVQENLTGVRVVRAFGREKHELEKFDKQNNYFASLWVKLGNTLSVYWGVSDMVTGVQIFTIIIVGAILAANGQITLGEYLVFVSYNQSLAWPVRALGRTLSEMSKTGVSVTRIQEIFNEPKEKEEPNAKKPPLNVDIRFENVSFWYDKQQVLSNLSFTIPKGETFGVMGETGSGKSTITYLLNRLYDLPLNGGKIWFGDVEIREIDRYYLRKNVGVVLQEPFLFSKTIEENIAITMQEADHSRVCHSASIAAIDSAIRGFAHGYETVVGERGVTLSGGQKQRVAIARTLLTKAPVMVFDDSLSAVDLETDARIRKALNEETSGTTVVLISHRINTIMQAENILVVENGKVTDVGKHEELILREGLYKRIYEIQSSAALNESPEVIDPKIR